MALDDKGRSLQGRLDFCERNTKMLQAGMKTVLKNHEGQQVWICRTDPAGPRLQAFASTSAEGCQAFLDLSAKIRDSAAQEQFIQLQEDLIAIAECTRRLAESRAAIMCGRGKTRIMETITYIQDRILQPTKLLLRDRERAIGKYDAMHKKVGAKGDVSDRLATEDDGMRHIKVANYRECVRNTEEIVNANFRCFEKDRVIELKIMLEELLRAEMLYHCRAIEVLEPMCVTMRALNPDEAMEVSLRDDSQPPVAMN